MFLVILLFVPFQLWVLTGSESGVELPQMSSPVNGTWVGWLGWRWLWQFVVVSSQANPRQDMEKNLFFLWNGYRTTYPPRNWLILADKTFPSSCRNYFDICNKMMLAKQQYIPKRKYNHYINDTLYGYAQPIWENFKLIFPDGAWELIQRSTTNVWSFNFNSISSFG